MRRLFSILIVLMMVLSLQVSAQSSREDLEKLGLSNRTFNALRNNSIHSIAQLTELTEEALLRLRGLGKGGLEDIKVNLGARGLALSGQEPLIKSFAASDEGLTQLNLQNRTLNALQNNGITSITPLTQQNEESLLRLPGLGRLGVEEIKTALSRRGLSLAVNTETGDIERLGLTNRTLNALRSNGITSIAQLTSLTQEDLRVPGLGQVGLEDIKSALHRHGLSLAVETKAGDIFELGLQTRTFNALHNNNITMIAQLTQHTEEKLLRLPGLAKGGVENIKNALSRRGLTLAGQSLAPHAPTKPTSVTLEMVSTKVTEVPVTEAPVTETTAANSTPLDSEALKFSNDYLENLIQLDEHLKQLEPRILALGAEGASLSRAFWTLRAQLETLESDAASNMDQTKARQSMESFFVRLTELSADLELTEMKLRNTELSAALEDPRRLQENRLYTIESLDPHLKRVSFSREVLEGVFWSEQPLMKRATALIFRALNRGRQFATEKSGIRAFESDSEVFKVKIVGEAVGAVRVAGFFVNEDFHIVAWSNDSQHSAAQSMRLTTRVRHARDQYLAPKNACRRALD